MNYNTRRAVIFGLVIVGLAMFASHILGYSYFERTASRTPNNSSGETFNVNRHGDHFYITKGTYFVWQALLYSSGLTLVLASYLDRRWRISKFYSVDYVSKSKADK